MADLSVGYAPLQLMHVGLDGSVTVDLNADDLEIHSGAQTRKLLDSAGRSDFVQLRLGTGISALQAFVDESTFAAVPAGVSSASRSSLHTTLWGAAVISVNPDTSFSGLIVTPRPAGPGVIDFIFSNPVVQTIAVRWIAWGIE